MNSVLDFIKLNYKTILKVAFGIFILYWMIYILTPQSKMSTEQKQLLDSLNAKIGTLHKDNLKLENDIDFYNQKIVEIDGRLDNLKGQKTIIKEYYHEKINSVDKLTDAELDSFFAKRYNY